MSATLSITPTQDTLMIEITFFSVWSIIDNFEWSQGYT